MLAPRPLSASPELDELISGRLGEAVDLACRELGESLRSIVLGGSLARGEAFGVREDSDLRLLSDLDLYLVVDGPVPRAPVLRALRDWAMADSFLVSPLDIAIVTHDFFSEARSGLPAHQLAHGHRILRGEPLDPALTVSARVAPTVDPEDAARLLLNRFAEALEPDPGGGDELVVLAHRIKEYIDAPMAWLASTGRYSPDRRQQVEAMREIARTWSEPARSRLEHFVKHWEACLLAREAGVIDRHELDSLAGVRGNNLSGGVTREDWTGAFAMAVFRGPEEGARSLEQAISAPLERASLAEFARDWLCRDALVARLRRARRWCSIAPDGVTPWWSHGPGGSGPDRIYAAACLCYHGVPGWQDSLQALLVDPVNDPGGLYEWWLRWIQGRDGDA